MNRMMAILTAGTVAGAALAAAPTATRVEEASLTPPLLLKNGARNHQYDPADPWLFTPYSQFPKDAIPVIVAGDPGGVPPDSAANRVDPNIAVSAYAGTCSLFLGGSALCTGAPTTNRHIISAGHCVDFDANGSNNVGTNVTVTFNLTGASSHIVNPSGIQSVTMHPDWTGFNNPGVNDDIIVITLKEANALPAEIPTYPLYRGTNSTSNIVHLVGYGQSGDAVNGYTIGAGFNVKRRGRNRTDRGFFADDEGSGMAEIFQHDFDSGAAGLGNDVETALGGGDSGGPAYIEVSPGVLHLYGVNTFTAGNAPFFGCLGGGILINGYLDFLDPIVEPVPGDFALTTPACGAVGRSPTLTLDWADSPNAETFTVDIATDAGFVSIVHTASGIVPDSYAVPGGALSDCTTYHWRVTAFNENGQQSSTPTTCSFTTAILGDVNGDGDVDTADLGGTLGSFGGMGPFGDINGDGIVDTADVGLLLSNFGQTCD
jgi:hypothetical protein